MELNNFLDKNPKLLTNENDVKWYVLRDLKRPNDKSPAFKVLGDAGFEVFTPMKQNVRTVKGKMVREEVPFLHDLLFVRSSKALLDTQVENITTLQYRYVRGGKYREGMTVDNHSMELFIDAIRSTTKYQLYQPSELTEKNIGAAIQIVGGPLDGYKGNLLKMQGSKKKRLLVSLQDFVTVSVEVEPEYIRIVDNKY